MLVIIVVLHIIAAVLLWMVGRQLENLFDWLFLKTVHRLPEGKLTVSELRKLWCGGRDGAEADVMLDAEGGWKLRDRSAN